MIDVLPVKTIRNPRDLGGYIGFDGRKIKRHRLLRTGKISRLSSEDETFLRNYGLKQIVDLRSPMECEKAPDHEINGVKHFLIPLSEEDNTSGGKFDIEKTFNEYRQDQYAGFRMMCERYRNFITCGQAKKDIHQIIELLLSTKDGATLYHCSEGKDRTGIVTVILLYLLGVNLETIRQDYLYSNYLLNDYRANRDQLFIKEGENLKFRANMRMLGSVCDAYLDSSLITIQEEYGDFKNYLSNGLQITGEMQKELQELYLEKK